MDVHRDGERLANYRAGLAPAATYNIHIPKHRRRLTPFDFFGDKKPIVAQSAETILRMLNATQFALKLQRGK